MEVWGQVIQSVGGGAAVSIFTQLLILLPLHLTHKHTQDPIMLSWNAGFKAAVLIASLWL